MNKFQLCLDNLFNQPIFFNEIFLIEQGAVLTRNSTALGGVIVRDDMTNLVREDSITSEVTVNNSTEQNNAINNAMNSNNILQSV